LGIVIDTAGPIAIVLRGLSEDQREGLKTQVGEGFARFASGEGYELPGVALCAVAS
jgi:hypothetical protein